MNKYTRMRVHSRVSVQCSQM